MSHPVTQARRATSSLAGSFPPPAGQARRTSGQARAAAHPLVNTSPAACGGGIATFTAVSTARGQTLRAAGKSQRPSGQAGWLSGLGKPAQGSPTPIGIARLAASAPLEQVGKEVEYFRLPVRSLLNRVQSDRVGFMWSINPYRGCEFGCQYCYARYTHEYLGLDPTEFEQKIYVKAEAARLLRRDLTPEKVLGEHIAIGAATDPYQPAERRFGVTRAVLETLLEFSQTLPGEGGLRLSLTTKSDLVLRDIPLLLKLSRRNTLHVNLSITTLHPRLARALEPRAPRPDLRLETVRQLNQAGISAGVFACPVLPGITDKPSDLEALVAAAARAGARYLCSNVVFLMPSSQRTFFPFLQEKFPRLLKQYRKWFVRSGYAPENYRREISALMGRLRAKHGLAGRWPDEAHVPDYSALAAVPPQLALPFAS